MKYIIANWKAHKSFSEVQSWTDSFISTIDVDPSFQAPDLTERLTVILCPPIPFIHYLKSTLQPYKFVKIGAQDVSQFEKGAYTGETTALNLSSLAEFSIIGHSERRANFDETESQISQKLSHCQANGIQPILCVRNAEDTIYESAQFVAYEPASAISTGPVGKSESVADITQMKESLGLGDSVKFIYGGSVTDLNCVEYLQCDGIDGLLVGSASLDPQIFCTILKKV